MERNTIFRKDTHQGILPTSLEPLKSSTESKTEQLAGRRFGRWTVLDEHIVSKKGERKWRCRCDCGTERYVLERSLRYGGTYSCGCMRRENAVKAVAHDLTGMTFGELTVLRKADRQRKNGGIWWLCICTCGREYEVSGSLLVTGRRTHCGGDAHAKKYVSSDITGQRFYRLVALYPTEQRSAKGSVVWHCRCDCGNEIDVSYNELVYCNMRSCGCRKKEHNKNLKNLLTHVSGTSLDMIKSQKLPADNTTGIKGVYSIKGRYTAKIVFQGKAYYLGTYEKLEEAAEVRKEAEQLLFQETVAYYAKWEQKAASDPEWAAENPVEITVRKQNGKLQVTMLPVLSG